MPSGVFTAIILEVVNVCEHCLPTLPLLVLLFGNVVVIESYRLHSIYPCLVAFLIFKGSVLITIFSNMLSGTLYFSNLILLSSISFNVLLVAIGAGNTNEPVSTSFLMLTLLPFLIFHLL